LTRRSCLLAYPPRDDDQGLAAAHRIGAELDVLPAGEGLLLASRRERYRRVTGVRDACKMGSWTQPAV
jgi:hypothetical protein